MTVISFSEIEKAILIDNPIKVICRMKTHRKYNCVGTIIKIEFDYSEFNYWTGLYDKVAIIDWGDHRAKSRFKRLDLLERFIGNPDQKCSGCNLPAPHTNSNIDNEGYLCSSCKTMDEILLLCS